MSDDRDANLYPFTPPPPAPEGPGKDGRPRRPRRSRLTKTAAGLVVILGTGTGAAAVALATSSGTVPASASSASTKTTTAGPDAATPATPPGVRRAMFGRGGGFGGPGGLASRLPAAFAGPGGFVGALGGRGVIHASYTIKGADGTYRTIDTQMGTVEDVSSTSITVKSADGFSQTYDVTTSTIVDADYEGILSVNLKDTVSVQALADGPTITAQRVQDITQVQANQPSWDQGPSAGPGGPAVAPAAPAASTTSTTTSPDAS
jgi:hypothetical protein